MYYVFVACLLSVFFNCICMVLVCSCGEQRYINLQAEELKNYKQKRLFPWCELKQYSEWAMPAIEISLTQLTDLLVLITAVCKLIPSSAELHQSSEWEPHTSYSTWHPFDEHKEMTVLLCRSEYSHNIRVIELCHQINFLLHRLNNFLLFCRRVAAQGNLHTGKNTTKA